MKHYLDAGNRDRLYSEHGDCADLLNDENFDYDKASGRVLGRDIGRILTEESRLIIEQAVSDEDEAERFAAAMARNRVHYHGSDDEALAMLDALRRGLSDH